MSDYSADYRLSYGDDGDSCQIRFRCFDTPNSIILHGCGYPDYGAEELLVGMRRLCLELHGLWSFSQAGSDISRVNEETRRIRVDQRTARLVDAMKAFHDSEPRFDFTVGRASFLWKRPDGPPSDVEVREALEHVGAELVSTCAADTVLKEDPRTKVDVGGAAKGYAADALAALVREAGYSCADIDLGGNLYLVGLHPLNRPWRVSIRVPEGVDAHPGILEVADASVVTSGTYERFIESEGRVFHHIVDPSTGYPAQTDLVSATVAGESSLVADMLATSIIVGSSGELPELAKRHPAYRIVALGQGGEVYRFN